MKKNNKHQEEKTLNGRGDIKLECTKNISNDDTHIISTITIIIINKSQSVFVKENIKNKYNGNNLFRNQKNFECDNRKNTQ